MAGGGCLVAAVCNVIGHHRWWQRQIRAKRYARQNADGGIGFPVTRPQQGCPTEGCNGQRDAEDPAAILANRPRNPLPQGHGECAAEKIQKQEEPRIGFGLQPVADVENHQHGRHRAGEAVEECDSEKMPDPGGFQQR